MAIRRLVVSLLACSALLGLGLVGRAELDLQKVLPVKIFCLPGETNTLEITIANPETAAVSAHLKVELVHELDHAVMLKEGDVSVEPGKTLTWSLPWKAEPWLGIEVRATLSRGGATLATKSDYFTCARSVHQVMVSSQFGLCQGALDSVLDQQVKAYCDSTRRIYGNWGEQFAWAPTDCDKLTPDTDRFWAGQTQYNESKTNILAMYHAAQAQGVHCMCYVKAGGDGPITFETLRAHPEYPMYGNGRPAGGAYSAAALDYLDTIGPPKPGETSPVAPAPEVAAKSGYAGAEWFTPFFATKIPNMRGDIWYDGANDDVITHFSHELVNANKVFGFAGCRFDGEFSANRFQRFDGSFNVPADFKADVADARWVRNMKQQVWASAPGFLFAYNTHVDMRWNLQDNSAPLAFREKCKDDGLIVQEEMAFPGGMSWSSFINTIKHHCELTRAYGGHYAPIPFNRNTTVYYCAIVSYALHGHSHFPVSTNLPLGAFSTRFASLLWDDAVHCWSGAGDAFSVEGKWEEPEADVDVDVNEKDVPEEITDKGPKPLHEVWWKPFASVRPAPDGGTQIILSLINAPRKAETPNMEATTKTGREKYFADLLPDSPAKEVVVHWKKPAGFRRALLADLDRNDLQPLKAKQEGNELVFTVPEVAHWSMLIIECDMPTPPVEVTPGPAVGKQNLPSAQDLGLAPVIPDPNKWEYTMKAADFGGNTTSSLARDADGLNPYVLRVVPGRPAGYLATGTYIFPSIAGNYEAKFRLKVADNTIDKPVISISVDDSDGPSTNHGNGLTLKGTDFAKPNVYQEFTVKFKHADAGYQGVVCVYAGNGEVWWDQTAMRLVERWTSKDFDAFYAGDNPPDDIDRAPHPQTNVLLVRGPWNRLYQPDAALAQFGSPVEVTNAYIEFDFQAGVKFAGFKFDWASLYKQDVLLLDDAEVGSMGYGVARKIRQWVNDGGSLVVLGGMYTLGQSGIMQYGWPDFLPVILHPPFEIKRCDPPVLLAPAAKALGVGDAGAGTAVCYRHVVESKPGATVLLAGKNGEPLLVGGSYGKGRVVVFTGTVLGDPPAGVTACWKSPAWPQLLAAALRWSRGK